MQTELRTLTRSLRSSQLKTEVQRIHDTGASGDAAAFQRDIHLLHDLRAKRVLLSMLAERHANYAKEEYIARALANLVTPHDEIAVPLLLAELEPDSAPPSGGGEVQIPRAKYRYAIALALSRIVDDLQLATVMSRQNDEEERDLGTQWAAHARAIRGDYLSESAASEVVKRVRDWQAQR